ncbi:MAG: hypothetical protein ACLPX9_18290 [Rhodomicrobium sp.]
MRWLLPAIGSMFLVCPAAFADCESDAKAAFARINSGSYHFEKIEWPNRKPVRITGEVIPGVKMRYSYEGQEREEYYERVEATRYAMNVARDAFGWKGYGKANSYWREEPGLYIIGSTDITGYKCSEEQGKGRGRIFVFQKTSRCLEKWVEDKLFVASQSELPFRREVTWENAPECKETTDYRYDPAIVIEKPRINLRARWDASIRAYEESVKASDPSCRQEVLKILDKGSSSVPFEYSSKSVLVLGDAEGIFDPSGGTYRKEFGEVGYFELISIAGHLWVKGISTGGRWRLDQDHPKLIVPGENRADWIAPVHIDLQNQHPAKNAGYASCATVVTEADRRYLVHTYDVFQDTKWERKLDAHRRMFVDPESGLPVRFESRRENDSLLFVETRRYDTSLTVREPKEGE